MNISFRAHSVAFLTIVIWSLTFVQTKILLLYLSPVEILIDRFVIAWVLFWVLAPRFVRTSRREELLFVLLGASGIFGYYILENLALDYGGAINVGLIVTTAPIFTTLILLKLNSANRYAYLWAISGFGLVLSGLAVMGYGESGELGVGDWLALLGAMAFGVYSVLLGRVDGRFDALIVTRKSFFYGVLFLLGYALLRGEPFHWAQYHRLSVWSNLLFLALVASGLCYVMWRWSVARIGAASASNYIYLVPIINAIAAVWVLDEMVAPRVVLAGMLILGGLVIAQRQRI